MSTNKQALREAAEKATHGEWLLEYGEDGFDGDDALIQCEVQGRIPVARIEGAHPESGFDADFQQEQQANAEFIAAANPATVLALLDELKAKDKRIAELEVSANASLKYASELESEIESMQRKEHHRDRQSVIDALATSGEAWSDIEEYMQKWDAEHAAGITVKGDSE